MHQKFIFVWAKYIQIYIKLAKAKFFKLAEHLLTKLSAAKRYLKSRNSYKWAEIAWDLKKKTYTIYNIL